MFSSPVFIVVVLIHLLPGLILAGITHRILWRDSIGISLRQTICGFVAVTPLIVHLGIFQQFGLVGAIFDRSTVLSLLGWLPFALILEAIWQNRLKARTHVA